MDKPRGGETRATDPKGEMSIRLGLGELQIQKPSRPLTAGKGKPRGGEKRAVDPQGEN